MEMRLTPFRLFGFLPRLDIMEVMKRLCAPPILYRRVARRRGTFGRTYGVRAVDVQSLDQYLANRLASDHLFQVVTDPKLADRLSHGPRRRKSRIETGGDFSTARAREAGARREAGVKSGQRQGASHQSHARRNGEQAGAPGRATRSAAAKATCSWWTPSRARWSGRYTSSPRVRAPKNWIAQPPIL